MTITQHSAITARISIRISARNSVPVYSVQFDMMRILCTQIRVITHSATGAVLISSITKDYGGYYGFGATYGLKPGQEDEIDAIVNGFKEADRNEHQSGSRSSGGGGRRK